jgi:small-conductance mechanosensitive channel
MGDMSGTLVFGFSWLLVMAIGLMPLAEGALARSPSITMPTTIVFFVALGSAILLRHRYSWMGLVLHIFSQIAIWLSLFVMSLAIVLITIQRGWFRTVSSRRSRRLDNKSASSD